MWSSPGSTLFSAVRRVFPGLQQELGLLLQLPVQQLRSISSCSTSCAAHASTDHVETEEASPGTWKTLIEKMPARINPCNSPLHPAVLAGIIKPNGDEKCVQEAYTPNSTCFGCGPANNNGLGLRSWRIQDGLEGTVTLPAKYSAFPGIVNGGIVSTVMDCHGNWTAAIALMDKACLPRPPLTLTAALHVNFKEPTPPEVQLVLRSKVLSIKETTNASVNKVTVEVEIKMYQAEPHDVSTAVQRQSGIPDHHTADDPPGMKLLASAITVHKRLGALRAL